MNQIAAHLCKKLLLLLKLSGGLTQPFTTQALPDSLPSPHSCPATHQQCLGAACPDLYLWSQCNCSECPTLKTLYGHLAKLNHFLFPNLSVLSPASRLLYLLSLCPGKLAPSLSAWLTPTHASGFSCSITSSRKSSWNSDWARRPSCCPCIQFRSLTACSLVCFPHQTVSSLRQGPSTQHKVNSQWRLMVQWLRLHLPVQGLGFNPWSGS